MRQLNRIVLTGLLATAALLHVVLPAAAQEIDELVQRIGVAEEKAQQLLQAKDYNRALTAYDGIRKDVEASTLPEETKGKLLQAVHYNRACAFALKGDKTKALDAFEQALDAGFGDFDHIEKDTDLDSIRKDPRFRKALAQAKEKAKAAAPLEKSKKQIADAPAPGAGNQYQFGREKTTIEKDLLLDLRKILSQNDMESDLVDLRIVPLDTAQASGSTVLVLKCDPGSLTKDLRNKSQGLFNRLPGALEPFKGVAAWSLDDPTLANHLRVERILLFYETQGQGFGQARHTRKGAEEWLRVKRTDSSPGVITINQLGALSTFLEGFEELIIDGTDLAEEFKLGTAKPSAKGSEKKEPPPSRVGSLPVDGLGPYQLGKTTLDSLRTQFGDSLEEDLKRSQSSGMQAYKFIGVTRGDFDNTRTVRRFYFKDGLLHHFAIIFVDWDQERVKSFVSSRWGQPVRVSVGDEQRYIWPGTIGGIIYVPAGQGWIISCQPINDLLPEQ